MYEQKDILLQKFVLLIHCIMFYMFLNLIFTNR